MIPIKVNKPKAPKRPNPNKVWVAVSGCMMVINLVCLVVSIIGFVIINSDAKAL